MTGASAATNYACLLEFCAAGIVLELVVLIVGLVVLHVASHQLIETGGRAAYDYYRNFVLQVSL